MSIIFYDNKDPGVVISIYSNPYDGACIDYDSGKPAIFIKYHDVDDVFLCLGVTSNVREYYDRGYRCTFKTLSIDYLNSLIEIAEESL